MYMVIEVSDSRQYHVNAIMNFDCQGHKSIKMYMH